MLAYQIIDFTFQVIYLALMVRILLSWIPHDPYHPVVEKIYQFTDPILKPFRDIIPPLGGVDISPIAAFIVLGIIKRILLQLIF